MCVCGGGGGVVSRCDAVIDQIDTAGKFDSMTFEMYEQDKTVEYTNKACLLWHTFPCFFF